MIAREDRLIDRFRDLYGVHLRVMLLEQRSTVSRDEFVERWL